MSNEFWHKKKLVDIYAIQFQLFCAEINNLKLSVGDKIDHYVHK